MTDREYRRLYDISPEEAQNTLFREYVGYVYAIVYNKLRSCANTQDIEECVGDVFLAVYLSYDEKGRFEGDLKGFIGTIASRKAINRFHSLTLHNGRTVSMEDELTEIADSERIEENAEKSELRRIFIRLINSLGKPDSTIIFRKFYYNRDSKAIAKELSMTPEAVRTRCSRAMKKLEKLLSNEGITLKEGY